MIRVYVAGAYSANNVIDVLKNIGRGENIAAELFQRGFAPFVPWHDKDFIIKNPEGKFTVDMFYKYSMEWLRVSDCLLILSGYEKSKGTLAEIKEAERLNIPVFYDINELKIYKW